MADDASKTLASLVGLPDGAGRVPVLIFAAHAAVAFVLFGLAASSIPDAGVVNALPLFGIGLLFLLLGRSAGRLAALR